MKFNKLLNAKNLKSTPQRILILNVILKNGHIDIEEIYKKVSEVIPSISIATIYKNLKLLVDTGIVKEVNISSFKTLYELNTNPHFHLICKKCKKILDVNIEDKKVKEFFVQVIGKDVESYEVNVYTKCRECKDKNN